MTQTLVYYRVRIRDAADTTDALVVSTFPGDANPFLSSVPVGDGGSLDIVTGGIQQGAFAVRLADAPLSATRRILTEILNDSAGKPWLLGRKVYIDESTTGIWPGAVYYVGYLKRLRLVTAIGWEMQIGDVQKAEGSYKLWSTLTSAFSKGVNILGEPITGGWGPLPAIGQTIFKVTQVTTKRVKLTYQNGPLPPDYVNKFSGNKQHYIFANRLANPFAVPSNRWTNEDAGVRFYFPRLLATLVSPTSGAAVGTFLPIAQTIPAPYRGDPILQPADYAWGGDGRTLMSALGEIWLDWPSGGSPAQPALNTLYAVRLGPIDISELNPLHIEMHPIDIETAAYTEAGIPYSAASATTVKAALGLTLRARLRIVGSGTLGELLPKYLRGPLGYGVRIATDGTREFFMVRDLPAALPGTTITVNDLRSSEGVIYDTDDSSILTQVNWSCRTFDRWVEDRDGGNPPNDLIMPRPVTYQVVNGDAGKLSGKDHSYELPGHFYDSRGADLFPTTDFFAAQAQRLFDRFGRGGVESEVQLLRGISPALGSFVMLNLPHLPVAIQGSVPVTQRGQGLRVVQVKRSRPHPQGPILTVLDCGRNAQPSVGPTISVAAAAIDPKHYAEVTVTNVAALQAAGVELVRFQMATGASAPTDGGPEIAKRGVFELVATNVVLLPKVAAGEKVWVRAQAKDTQQLLPSPWTAWISVTLTALGAPSGITQSAGANDTERVIRWSLAAIEGHVMVRWKLTANLDWESSAALLPGSVEYTLRGLIPGAGGVTVQVTVVDDGFGPGESAAATVSFTPGSTNPTLPVPWSPAGWAGPQDDLSGGPAAVPDGSFGLDVTAAQWPAKVEVEIAVETAIGSGAYGAYVTVANPLVQQGYRTRTRFTFYAPNDRLRRKLRARHALPGYTSSSYTAEVVVSPWVPQKSIIPAIAAPTFAISGKVSGTIENPTAYLLALYATPPNPHFDYVRYRVRQRQLNSTTWGEETIVVGGRDGDDLIPVQFGVQAEVRLDVINTDGIIDTSASVQILNTPRFPKAELWSFDAAGADTGFLSPAQVGREPARLTVGFVPNEHTVLVEVYSEEHTSDPGDARNLNDGRTPEIVLPVEPARITPAFGLMTGTPQVVALPLSASGNYRLITVVPYDRLGRIGEPVLMKQNGDGTALPSAPSAASNVSVPGGGTTAPQNVRNSVTPSSSVNMMRLYRNGRFYKDFGPGTSGVAQNDDNVAVSGQVDRWEYCHYTGTPTNARESARTTMFVTTTPTLKLAAVTSIAVLIPGSPTPPSPADAVISQVPWDINNPQDTVGIVRRAPDVAGVPGAWTEVDELAPFQDGLRYTPGAGTWWFSVLFRRTGWTDSNAAQAGPYAYP